MLVDSFRVWLVVEIDKDGRAENDVRKCNKYEIIYENVPQM